MTDQKTQGQILNVNSKGLFVDGKPTTTYNGAAIASTEKFSKLLGTDFVEVEIMQSDLSGQYSESGQPTPDDMGLYTWLRAKTKDGLWSDWLRLGDYTGYPVVAKEPFQSNQEQVRQRLKRDILADAFVLQSTKRPDFRKAVLANVVQKKEKIAQFKQGQKVVDAMNGAQNVVVPSDDRSM